MTVAREQRRERRPGCGPGTGLDPDAWFPLRETDTAVEVLAICAACPVRRRCLVFALARPEVGIWAGTTTLDRTHARTVLRSGAPTGIVLDELLAIAATRTREADGEWTAKESVAS